MRSSDGVQNVSAAIPSAQNVCIQGYKGGTNPPELERCPNICGRLIHGSFRVNIGIARMTEIGPIVAFGWPMNEGQLPTDSTGQVYSRFVGALCQRRIVQKSGRPKSGTLTWRPHKAICRHLILAMLRSHPSGQARTSHGNPKMINFRLSQFH
jgi:hypothetical protein